MPFQHKRYRRAIINRTTTVYNFRICHGIQCAWTNQDQLVRSCQPLIDENHILEAPSTSYEIKQEELEFDEVIIAIYSWFSQNLRGYYNWAKVQEIEKMNVFRTWKRSHLSISILHTQFRMHQWMVCWRKKNWMRRLMGTLKPPTHKSRRKNRIIMSTMR